MESAQPIGANSRGHLPAALWKKRVEGKQLGELVRRPVPRYSSAHFGFAADPAPRAKACLPRELSGMAKAMPRYELPVAPYSRLKKPSILRHFRVHALGP